VPTPKSAFSYHLPKEAIAQVPAEPRDASKLLDARDLSDHAFTDLPDLLSPGDLLVVNRSRVRAARLIGIKSATGGQVEILLLRPVTESVWEALVKPARRLRSGTEINFGELTAVVESEPQDGMVLVSLKADGSIEEAIRSVGHVPLPPYIRTELGDPERYQTIFANQTGSAAAPTAGLHFTDGLVSRLASCSIEIAEIELRIGLDTFLPISTDCIEDHRIHTEEFEVPESTAHAIQRCRGNRGRVVAVGTTVVRALETAATNNGLVRAGEGSTGLFITPGFRFRVVDLLITNFHLPASSLIVLVASFMGDRWRAAYEAALARRYRFASFGDSMLATNQARMR
jgi:S-adenosylmethionine:tRNA ribosyltransferase-isomerase